jgi:hypothetical protein
VKQQGLRLCEHGRVITVFTSSGYCGGDNGAGALFISNNKIRLISYMVSTPPFITSPRSPTACSDIPCSASIKTTQLLQLQQTNAANTTTKTTNHTKRKEALYALALKAGGGSTSSNTAEPFNPMRMSGTLIRNVLAKSE